MFSFSWIDPKYCKLLLHYINLTKRSLIPYENKIAQKFDLWLLFYRTILFEYIWVKFILYNVVQVARIQPRNRRTIEKQDHNLNSFACNFCTIFSKL